MVKQNTTNTGFFGFLETCIRLIPIIYIFVRHLIRFTNYFEEEFATFKITIRKILTILCKIFTLDVQETVHDCLYIRRNQT